MKKNELNQVFLELGYSSSAVFLFKHKVTAADDTRIILEEEEYSVSHLRHAKRVGTWSGYLFVAFEDCIFSVGLRSPWSSCPPIYSRETYWIF